MPRTITIVINAVQLTAKPSITANDNGTGSAAAPYVVGVYDPVSNLFVSHPEATQVGQASITIAATDTIATALPNLAGACLDAEELTPGTDHVVNEVGTLIG